MAPVFAPFCAELAAQKTRRIFKSMEKPLASLFRAFALSSPLLLIACGGGDDGGASPTSVSGVVEGGGVRLSGATVFAYASNAGSGEVRQLGTASTNSGGSFSIVFNGAPAEGDVVYLISSGGTSQAGNNPAISFIGVAGGYGYADFSSQVFLNELTTVAATAELQGFLAFEPCSNIVGNTRSGDCPVVNGSAGLADRARTISSLVDVSAGEASDFLVNAPADSAVHTNRRRLNSLASILADCAAAAGPASPACASLFAVAGSAPDTLSAAHAIAATPAVNSDGSGIFSLLPVAPVFTPVLAAAPANWTVGGQRIAFALAGSGAGRAAWGYRQDISDGLLRKISPTSLVGNDAKSIVLDPLGRFVFVVSRWSLDPDTPIGFGFTTSIATYLVDRGSGALVETGFTFAAVPNIRSFILSPDGKFAYVTTHDGEIFVSRISSAGELLPGGAATDDSGLQALTIAPTGKVAYVSDWTGSRLSAYRIDPQDGSLHFLDSLHSSAPVTSIHLHPGGKLAYALHQAEIWPHGLSLWIYKLDSSGKMVSAAPADVAIPSQSNLTMSPDGRFLYGSDSGGPRVTTYGIDAESGDVALEVQKSLTFPPYEALSTDRTGRFAYLLRYQDERIAAYAIGNTGELADLTPWPYPVGHYPKEIAVTPDGQHVFVSNSIEDSVYAFVRDPVTGSLSSAGAPVVAGDGAMALATHPSSNYLYVANYLGGTLSAFRIHSDGALSAIDSEAGMPFAKAALTSPDGKRLYVAHRPALSIPQFGAISVFDVDASTGELDFRQIVTFDSEPNSMDLDPSGEFLHVVMSQGDDMAIFSVDSVSGLLALSQTQNLGYDHSQVRFSPSGEVAFAARGNCVASYTVDAVSSAFAETGYSCTNVGSSFTVDPIGDFLLAPAANLVYVWDVDGSTGATSYKNHLYAGNADLRNMDLAPDGKHVYALDYDHGSVRVFDLDRSAGGLSELLPDNAPIVTGSNPSSLVFLP